MMTITTKSHIKVVRMLILGQLRDVYDVSSSQTQTQIDGLCFWIITHIKQLVLPASLLKRGLYPLQSMPECVNTVMVKYVHTVMTVPLNMYI